MDVEFDGGGKKNMVEKKHVKSELTGRLPTGHRLHRNSLAGKRPTDRQTYLK